MSVQAIPTRYAGCHFRSRLEARWAVFFDALGVPWEYEPQGFEWSAGEHPVDGYTDTLTGGRYLPDFWLPSIKTWFEVKGAKPTSEEMRLCYELSVVTGQRVILSSGDIPRNPDEYGRDNGVHEDNMLLNGGVDHPYHWCVCPRCGKPGIEFDARGARVCDDRVDDKGYTGDDDRILEALNAARSARFEHGESGAT